MAQVMVIGAGVVGKATGAGMMVHGHEVTYVDVNPRTIEALNAEGHYAILPEAIDLTGIDVVFMAVTALTGENGIDLTHLLAATRNLGHKLGAPNSGAPVIVYRCTMPPGTTRNTLVPILAETSGRVAGKDFGVVYNPEYLRAANANEDFLNPRVVTLSSLEENDFSHRLLYSIMQDFGAEIHWLPFEAAEFHKYVNNVYNAVKISTMNWFRLLGQGLGLSPDEINHAFELSVLSAEGFWNPRYGTRDFGAYGGACLPKDIRALELFAAGFGEDVTFLQLIQEINHRLGGD